MAKEADSGMVMVGVKIPKPLNRSVEISAATEGITKQELYRLALQGYVDDRADAARHANDEMKAAQEAYRADPPVTTTERELWRVHETH